MSYLIRCDVCGKEILSKQDAYRITIRFEATDDVIRDGVKHVCGNCINDFNRALNVSQKSGQKMSRLFDADELVRCKDCKHRPRRIEKNGGNWFDLEFPDNRCPCQGDDGWYNWMPDDNWFCGNGERKEE